MACVLWGESWLSVTARVPASVLIVEGWIHSEGMPATAEEFRRGGYDYLVVTGGPSGPSWALNRFNLAENARQELLVLGLSADKLLSAPSLESDSQRTFESALAAKRLLELRGFAVGAINVFSRGPHCRRTRLVYSKVFGPATRVGIVAWCPYATQGKAWWQSSERTKEMVTESLGYLYEWVLNSGRPGGKSVLYLACAIPCAVFALFRLFRRLTPRKVRSTDPSCGAAGEKQVVSSP